MIDTKVENYVSFQKAFKPYCVKKNSSQIKWKIVLVKDVTSNV